MGCRVEHHSAFPTFVAARLSLACLAACTCMAFAAGTFSSDSSSRSTTASTPPASSAEALSGAADRHGPASIQSARRVWSLADFVNDMRLPRPPKVRSERPTTGVDAIDASMAQRMIDLLLAGDLNGRFSAVSASVRPLAGHYRMLLRPPASLG